CGKNSITKEELQGARPVVPDIPGVRILAGNKAAPGRWPWQAALLMHGRLICGAALIDSNWAASAAHCFQRSSHPSDFRILLGYNQLSNPSGHSRQMTVNKIIVHPEYNQHHNMGSDITLLQMHLPVEFNAHIRPACIPEPTISLPTKLNCWISGWGMLTEQKFLPEPLQLQEAEVTLVTNNYCKIFYPTPPGPPRRDVYGIYDDMVCAGDLFTGKSICRGDSGGPLVCPLNGTWFLIGVSSFSMECNRHVSLSVFTRISYFANWIDESKKATPTADPSLAPPQEVPSAVNSMASRGTVHRPGICVALVSSHVFLLLLIVLRRL
ncbi:PREDICTED: serine protease 40-like, partial [Galeopterus variegatus]|uniref:Serine protease 40-like n=1 Tax=Galeopterus variegatus TaxID=482537 RepID=A0ABM0S8Y7_GALVR